MLPAASLFSHTCARVLAGVAFFVRKHCFKKEEKGVPSGSVVKNPLSMQETQVQSLSREDALEKRMTTHPSILAWRIPRTEEPHGL